MGVLQRFEQRLKGVVGTTFARIFKDQVEPVEVAKALAQEAEDKRAIVGEGQTLVPNRYLVELSTSDHERFEPWEVQLSNTLAEMVQEHIDDEGWSTFGDIEVKLVRADDLVTGVFRVASRVDPNVAPRRRPRDALSASGGDGWGQNTHYDAPSPAFSQAQYQSPPQPVQQYRHWISIDGSDRTFDLFIGSTVIGRGQDAQIRLPDTGVSRRHAEVRFDGQVAVVNDLGSTNGTTVNGQPVQSSALQHGDVIRLGHSTLVYRQDYA